MKKPSFVFVLAFMFQVYSCNEGEKYHPEDGEEEGVEVEDGVDIGQDVPEEVDVWEEDIIEEDASGECGNGIIEDVEECDGSDLGGKTCESMGLGGGDLACSDDCTLDTGGCTGTAECGNGAREYPEQCDGDDLGGADCGTLGYDDGTLACAGDCSFDTSGCTMFPTVEWTVAAHSVGEDVGTVTITAVLSVPGAAPVTAPFTVSGTAVNPADHDLADGSIMIPAGSLTGSRTFNVVDDALIEGDETVIATMDAPTGAALGAVTVHTATIEDNDSTIQVTSPNGGEILLQGSTHIVAWISNGVSGTVDIAFSCDGGPWIDIATGELDDGAYSWTVPSGVDSADCLIRVQELDGSPSDLSDSPFTIWNGIWKADADAPVVGDGRTWETAFRHPEDAMAVVVPGDEVWVAGGTYTPLGANTYVVTLVAGIEIYGGFEGISGSPPETDRTQRNAEVNVTVLEGQNTAYHVVIAASSCLIDGFTATGGNANGAGSDDTGGGVYGTAVTGFTISNCSIVGNSADFGGGGMYLINGDAVISDCVLDGNSTTGGMGGGAMALMNIDFNVIRTLFMNNTSSNSGGAIAMNLPLGPVGRITSSLFHDNHAGADGGAICVQDGEMEITNSTLSRNTAAGAAGGVSFMSPLPLRIGNSIIWGNIGAFDEEFSSFGPPGQVGVRYSDFPVSFMVTDGGGNFYVDPGFADVASGDFRLTNASCCIDAADSAVAPPQDLDGNGWHDDSGMPDVGAGPTSYVDIGAYEFQQDTVLRVTSPNLGTEIWRLGTNPTINWYSTAAVDNVHIELSRDAGLSWEDIAASTPAAWGSYSGWTATGSLSKECLIRISDADNFDVPTDTSDNRFSIFSNSIWHVDPTAGGANNGTNWFDAFTDIHSALAAARWGDQILVATGTYHRLGGSTVLMTMIDHVAIHGGFGSGGSPRDPVANPTVLNGQSLVYHVVAGANDAILDGFIIENGNANGGGDDDEGGGMINDGVSPTVNFCLFRNNSAVYGGGAISNNSSNASVNWCTFINNTSPRGGAVRNAGLTGPEFVGCIFDTNSGGAVSFGGAVMNSQVEVTLTSCVFSNNLANWGGAIFGLQEQTNLVNCTLSANTSFTNGGGYYGNSNAAAMMTNCIFWGNTGGVYPDIYDDSDSSTAWYCDIQQAPGSFGYSNAGGSLNVNPQFVGLGDLHLQATSHCIDAGDGDAAPTTDLDGNTRVDTPAVPNTGTGTPDYSDMGAYEYQP